MLPTRDARTARRKLGEVGVSSATVLVGSSTITIDLAAFDALVHWHRRYAEKPLDQGASGLQHMCDPYGCEQHPHVKPSQP